MSVRTDSFTRFSRNVELPIAPAVAATNLHGFGWARTAWRSALLLFASAPFIANSLAQSIQVREAVLEPSDNEYHVKADFLIKLGPALEDALNRGVPLYFELEFSLRQPRWWWFDKRVASGNELRKLAYNTLTRQYRLSIGSLHQDSSSLADALDSLGRVRGAPSFNAEVLQRGRNYIASIGLRLDVSQLPKPLQLDAVTSKVWQLASSGFTWDVHISP